MSRDIPIEQYEAGEDAEDVRRTSNLVSEMEAWIRSAKERYACAREWPGRWRKHDGQCECCLMIAALRALALNEELQKAMADCIGVEEGQTFEDRAEELIVTEVAHENARSAAETSREPPTEALAEICALRGELELTVEHLETANNACLAASKRLDEMTEYMHSIRPKADCYDRICQTLGIDNNVLGYIETLRSAQKTGAES